MKAVEEKEKVGVDGTEGVHDRMRCRVGFRCKDSYFVVNRQSIQKCFIFAGGLVCSMGITNQVDSKTKNNETQHRHTML